MSDILELPHEVLLRRYGLTINQMSSHTQQLKRDLDRTMQLILNKSRNGRVQVSEATQSKIQTYDRYICDGIFEYLEDKEVKTSSQSDNIENQMDEKRDNVINKMDSSSDPSNGQANAQQTKAPNTPPASDSSDSKAKIGFWDWA
jgi:hypothetical protein